MKTWKSIRATSASELRAQVVEMADSLDGEMQVAVNTLDQLLVKAEPQTDEERHEIDRARAGLASLRDRIAHLAQQMRRFNP